VKDALNKIIERREELESYLEGKEEAPVLLHPNMSQRYQKEVEALRVSLNREETRTEAADLLRGLIDKIVLTPKVVGTEYAIDLHGEAWCRVIIAPPCGRMLKRMIIVGVAVQSCICENLTVSTELGLC